MNCERPGHRLIGRQDHAQQKRGIKDVAVHGGDIRQPTEQVWVPLWKAVARFERRRRKLAKRIPCDVLIAAHPDEKSAAQRRVRERQRREHEDEGSPSTSEARCRKWQHRASISPRLRGRSARRKAHRLDLIHWRHRLEA